VCFFEKTRMRALQVLERPCGEAVVRGVHDPQRGTRRACVIEERIVEIEEDCPDRWRSHLSNYTDQSA
jgi:hypothetical protein